MKEYKLQCKPKDNGTWCSVNEIFDSVYDVIDRMNQEKKIDELYDSRKWEYRILSREVSEWEVL